MTKEEFTEQRRAAIKDMLERRDVLLNELTVIRAMSTSMPLGDAMESAFKIQQLATGAYLLGMQLHLISSIPYPCFKDGGISIVDEFGKEEIILSDFQLMF